MKQELAVFEGHEIRRQYDEKTETWWFSVVDIIRVLTQQLEHRKAQSYWTTLKNRLKAEGSEVVTKCDQLKMPAADGKSYLTDAATAETLLRLVQSVPSPKAEPIKLWLAKVGYERMQEMADPARSLARARETWQKQGRSAKWIEQRMTGQETRNKLTDYWAGHEIKKGDEFAILTNIIHQEWSGVGVQTHKDLKGLKTENLRDHNRSHTEIIQRLRGKDIEPQKILFCGKKFSVALLFAPVSMASLSSLRSMRLKIREISSPFPSVFLLFQKFWNGFTGARQR